ncbi:MAG: LLM class flavin-dependent oxidoreductase [Rhodospirillales bacterium]|nr:LLM class flavin-dependent oxidoreductase [Rhodospirillales bacterium]
MKIDLFLEFASPPRLGQSCDLGEIVEENIALVRAADTAGFDGVWIAEHHFLGDYSNAACPDMLLAAMARETRRIELGFGIVPLSIHDPVRVAERLATLDLLSHGRAMWGAGRGVTQTELAGFGIPSGETRARMETNLSALRDILRTGEVVRGEARYALRPTPDPRLARGWLAAVSPESFDFAAEQGLDVLAGPFKPWPMVAADLARYRARRPEGKTSYTLAAFCDTDKSRARSLAGPGIVWAFRRIFELTRPLVRGQLEGYEDYARFRWVAPLLEKALSVPVLETLGFSAIGDPDHLRRRFDALAGSGLDRVSLVLGGGDLPQADLLRSLDLIAEKVLPHFAHAATPGPAAVLA